MSVFHSRIAIFQLSPPIAPLLAPLIPCATLTPTIVLPASLRCANFSPTPANARQVVVLLQGKLADVSVNFKDVLETRTKNIQASRSRTENFVSSVSASSHASINPYQSASPLYSTTPIKSPSPSPGYGGANNGDLLGLEPSSAMALPNPRDGGNAEQQALMLEEGQPANTYINQRGEAIEVSCRF